ATEVWALSAYHTALRNYACNLEYGLGAAMALVLVVIGASRWQQIRYIILPQMRWPILFVTCYQTLSLLASAIGGKQDFIEGG
ncbi:hypothetical protein AB9F45_37735, partial [Rhizobium leguminosarum]